MQGTDRVGVVFADAWSLFQEAIDLLEAGNLRMAAEAAWGASKRAADALILREMGREPRTSGHTSRGLRVLSREDSEIRELRARYNARQSFLHGQCFYRGIPQGSEDKASLEIHRTADFIRDVATLAGYRLGV
jgi:hypothetical protein